MVVPMIAAAFSASDRRRLKEILAVTSEHEEAATLAGLVGDRLRATELMVEAKAALDRP